LVVPICGANYVSPKAKKNREIEKTPATPATTLTREPNPVPVSSSIARSMKETTASRNSSPKPGGDVNAEALQNPTPTTNPSPKRGGEHDLSLPKRVGAGEGFANPEALTQALQVTQQSLAAFHKLQEQTAQLHRQFLENQEAAQRTLQMLVEQQHALLLGGTVNPLNRPAPTGPLPPAPSRAAAPLFEPRHQSPTPPNRNGDARGNGEYRPVIAEAVQTQSAPPKSVPVKVQHNATAILLAVVAEKTGYPAEMLTPEMALDADLGIDSIKRVEIFSTLQERLPEAPVVKPEHLGSLQSLADVIAFLSSQQTPPSVVSTPNGEMPTSPAPTHPRLGSDKVAEVLFAVVAEKTGYPTEMLNAEMALDADLGIDSIKRVEIFSALQERLPDAPIVKPEHLGTLHSLGEVAAFLSGRNGTPIEPEPAKKKLVEAAHANTGNSGYGDQGVLVAEVASVRADQGPATVSSVAALIERSVLRAIPLPLNSSHSSVHLAAGSTVVIVGHESAVARTLKRHIEAAGHRVRTASWKEAPDRVEADAAGLLLVAPSRGAPDDLALRAFRWMRHFGPHLRSAGEKDGAILATVTQLDGAFGLHKLDAQISAHSGALAGLAKTAAREWPTVACKAIDLEQGLSESRIKAVWRQIVSRGQIVEAGFSSSGAVTLALTSEPIGEGHGHISSSDVVLITGGARGVTSAVAQVISEQCKPTLILMGRTDLEIPEPAWLRDCTTESAIKQALVRNLSPVPAPKAVEADYRKIVARRESLGNIARMKTSGARVVYRAVDVTDAASVGAALGEIRDSIGPVTHLIHGAGTLADRRIDDLTDEQFEQVYATKVAGLEALLRAIEADSLKAIMLFSSSTGRFGRIGQIAYAAANEALNKIAQQQARLRPACKVVAMNWGPWDGGMVTSALRKMFENEGVGVIPLRQGAEALLAELGADKSAVEVTLIAEPSTAEPAAPASSLHVVFEPEVSLRSYPILRSHVIDGRPVLPLALHLELLTHAALHGNPGLVFHGVNDLRVFNGVLLDGDEPARLKVLAGKAVKIEASFFPSPPRGGAGGGGPADTGFLVSVELLGARGPRDVVHSRGEVLLVPRLPAAGRSDPLPNLTDYPHTIADAYREQLFHGPDLSGIEKIEGIGPAGIVAQCRTAPTPATWLRQPLRGAWIADPLLIDAAFQMMILWGFAERQAGCLPCFVGKYRQYRRSFPAGPVRIQVRVKQTTGSLVKADIEFVDPAGDLLAEICDHESVIDENLNRSFRRNRLAQI
jgi:NAD(P)-dependent dehydrogenase (short-subunit alcohol dehydrogenase family)/acyl carrier protein